LLYSAELLGESADNITETDNAMERGVGWKLGPFEAWDAIGVQESIARTKDDGEKLPESLEQSIADGSDSLSKEENNKVFYYDAGEYKEIDFNPKEIHIKRLKDSGNVIKKNTGASLIDVGDGVALLEFTSPNNSIGLDVIQMINQSIEEVEKN